MNQLWHSASSQLDNIVGFHFSMNDIVVTDDDFFRRWRRSNWLNQFDEIEVIELEQ